MITEAQILKISNNGADCVVLIPVFQTINTDWPVEVPAVFLCPPGVYNGYVEGDFVWVAFERDMANLPVVIGKMYKGLDKEAEQNGSAIRAGNLTVAGTTTLPADTTFNFTDETTITVNELLNRIKTLEQETGANYQLKLKIRLTAIGDWPVNEVYIRTHERYSSMFAFKQNLYLAGFRSADNCLAVSNLHDESGRYSRILGFYVTYNQDTQIYTLYCTIKNYTNTYIINDSDILEFSCMDIRHI